PGARIALCRLPRAECAAMLPWTPRFLVRLPALALALLVCPLLARADEKPTTPAAAPPTATAEAKPGAPAAAPAPAATASPAPAPPPSNPKLEAAKALIAKKKYDDA